MEVRNLDEYIRISMAEMQNTDGAYCVPCGKHVDCVACQQFIDMITDILDRHPPVETEYGLMCTTCCEVFECGHDDAVYPCDTVKGIAESLGIEVGE
jgi:hypothetical protein